MINQYTLRLYNMLFSLLELRRRILQVSLFLLAWFVLFFCLSSELFHLLVAPLMRALPAQDSLIATQITAPVLTPIRLALDAALLCTAPFALFHVWKFVSPGLYHGERVGLQWLLAGSLTLFGVGVLFCFYSVLPFMFRLFSYARPPGVRFMPDMTCTVDFILHMLLLFGLCFQLPLVCVVLVRFGLLTVATLTTLRPYVIVIAFIVGMLLTPPDVLSQLMLAIPLCLLYEVGILLSR